MSAADGRTIAVSEKDSALIAGTTLEVAAGSLDKDTHITVEIGLDSLLDAEAAAGPVVMWGPPGTHFSKPARMTLPVTAFEDGDELSILVREADGTQFEVPSGAVTFANGKATFDVNGFTSFQPMRRRPCMADNQCRMGETCRSGRCRPPSNTCRSNADCPQGASCLLPTCLAGACTGTCQAPVACMANSNCPSGQVCVNGTCGPGPTACMANSNCRTGEVCVNGTCRPGPTACMANSNCPTGQVCVGGTCQSVMACPADAMQCPDGSFVSRTGPNCTFPACPTVNDGGMTCPQDAFQCPDGSFVSRTGPNCTFPACPTVRDAGTPFCQGFVPPCTSDMQCGSGRVCVRNAMQCNPSSCSCDPATGNIVCTADCSGGVCQAARDGGNVCPADAQMCPDGSFVTRTGPNCTFPACPSNPADGGAGFCQGFVPPCQTDNDCSSGQRCVQEMNTCNPSSCGCNPMNGQIICTADCSGKVCRAVSTPDSGVDAGVNTDGGVAIDGGMACPADAMQCPDGSFVSRTGPNCTFPACPGVRCQTSADCNPNQSCQNNICR